MELPSSPFLEIAIWEFCFDAELAPLEKRIIQRYQYLTKLRAIDLFLLADAKGMKLRKLIRALEEEISVLYAAKQMIVKLRTVYMTATADLGDAAHRERMDLLQERNYWKDLYQQEHAECLREKEQTLVGFELAKRFLHHGT